MGHRIEPQIPLGEAVKMVREEKKLTRAAVAGRAGVSARWLREVETGKANPAWANLRRVTLGLRVKLTELAAKVELARAHRRGWKVEHRLSGKFASSGPLE